MWAQVPNRRWKKLVRAPVRPPNRWVKAQDRPPEPSPKVLARRLGRLARAQAMPPRVRARLPRELEIRWGRRPKALWTGLRKGLVARRSRQRLRLDRPPRMQEMSRARLPTKPRVTTEVRPNPTV